MAPSSNSKPKARSPAAQGHASARAGAVEVKASPGRKRLSPSKKHVVELAPSNRAKCYGCGKLIHMGEGRIGTPYQLTFGNTLTLDKHHYYHKDCCPEDELKKIFPHAKNVEKRLQNKFESEEDQEEQNQYMLENDRLPLRKRLQKLRLRLMEEQGQKGGSTVILNLKTLDNIVLAMPKSLHEMKKVKGVGPTIVKNYGKPIVEAVIEFERMTNGESSSDDDDEEYETARQDEEELEDGKDPIEDSSEEEDGRYIRAVI